MQIMSAEAYQQVWLLFPWGLIFYCFLLPALHFFFGKRKAYICSLVITTGVVVFLWYKIGFNIGTYFIIALYFIFGALASFGRMRVRVSGGSSGYSSSFRGPSGRGGSGGNW